LSGYCVSERKDACASCQDKKCESWGPATKKELRKFSLSSKEEVSRAFADFKTEILFTQYGEKNGRMFHRDLRKIFNNLIITRKRPEEFSGLKIGFLYTTRNKE
jgi:hypothetical protein